MQGLVPTWSIKRQSCKDFYNFGRLRDTSLTVYSKHLLWKVLSSSDGGGLWILDIVPRRCFYMLQRFWAWSVWLGRIGEALKIWWEKTYDRYQRNNSTSSSEPAARQANNLFVCIFRNSDTPFFNKNKEQSSLLRILYTSFRILGRSNKNSYARSSGRRTKFRQNKGGNYETRFATAAEQKNWCQVAR